ncbi:hypothetical protein Nans01_22420 [Nocardiopsis ansamitocini]|uniref:Uncharacterized protein n=1 Tax=Nocardiopsis ansamitocini TaxID=1670832 RepID=A0A9W6P682_9ACTN|nr:hypothetical protein Nans01_22420 [Nocardiopsis ansamitocini]
MYYTQAWGGEGGFCPPVDGAIASFGTWWGLRCGSGPSPVIHTERAIVGPATVMSGRLGGVADGTCGGLLME